MTDKMADSGIHTADHLRNIRDEAGAAASELTGKARNLATDYAGQAKEYAQQGYRYAADKTKKAKETTEGFIQENPWAAVGIAVGVGLLAGLLLRGRSRD
jgi:ElaB/YqjD/DUF883 family membrane-anchored ribosome-binding protein